MKANLMGSEVTLKTGVPNEKIFENSRRYIAYLPPSCICFLISYGLLNIEGVADTDSRYNLFFTFIFGFIQLYSVMDFWLIYWWGCLMLRKAKMNRSSVIAIAWKYF